MPNETSTEDSSGSGTFFVLRLPRAVMPRHKMLSKY